jgi:hypothetical protein
MRRVAVCGLMRLSGLCALHTHTCMHAACTAALSVSVCRGDGAC